MNLWVARGAAARAEALIQSSIANWFISTKTGGPANGEVQDSVIGCRELTRSGVRLDKYHAMGLFAAAGVEPPRFDRRAAAGEGSHYTGREIASALLARTPVDFRRAPTSYSDVYAPYLAYDPDETLTVVEQGRLVRGVLDKAAIGAGATGGLFHLIGREYGAQAALDAIYAFQQVSLQFLMWRGFTVGAADLLPNAEARAHIRAAVAGALLEAGVVTGRLLRGEIVPPIDSTVRAFYERTLVESALKVPEETLRWVLGSMRPATNGFFNMIASGAKGSNPNLIHVSVAIGQTTIDGDRIRESFAFRRTLPYYARFSTEPAAYGFVANGYMVGMRTDEFICQDMNGRFDLINKALSTATTGYFMRKGVMNNQSSIVDNYRRVTKDTKIVQFVYGDDGCDPRELEKVTLRTVAMSDATLRAATWVDVGGFAAGAAAGAAPATATPTATTPGAPRRRTSARRSRPTCSCR